MRLELFSTVCGSLQWDEHVFSGCSVSTICVVKISITIFAACAHFIYMYFTIIKQAKKERLYREK